MSIPFSVGLSLLFTASDVYLDSVFASFGLRHKQSAHNVGYLRLTPGLGRSPEEGNGYPLQSFCLEHSMDQLSDECFASLIPSSPSFHLDCLPGGSSQLNLLSYSPIC